MGASPSDPLERFFLRCDAASWPEPLWNALLDYFAAHQVHTICYQHFPPLGAHDQDKIRVASSGFSDDWNTRYIKGKLFRTDPFPAQALVSSEPFWWSEIRARRELNDAEVRTLAILETAGKGDGLAVPVFGPEGRNGYFGLGLDTYEGRPPPTLIRTWQAACEIGHLRYCQIIRAGLPEAPALSDRERELLQWVARGKSNGVIAEIMRISPHTVDAYLRRVFSKLGTSDRISAAIRALGTGLIRGY